MFLKSDGEKTICDSCGETVKRDLWFEQVAVTRPRFYLVKTCEHCMSEQQLAGVKKAKAVEGKPTAKPVVAAKNQLEMSWGTGYVD